METQIKKVGEDIKIVITINATELAKMIGTSQTELFEMETQMESKENPFKYIQIHTRFFIQDLIKEFGINCWINRDEPIVNKLRWFHTIADVPQIFKRFSENGWMDVEYNQNKTRIIRFKFNDNAQWT